MSTELLEIAIIQRPHGFRGAFVVSKGASPDAWANATQFWIRKNGTLTGPFEPLEIAEMPKGIKVHFKEITSDTAAQALRGASIMVSREFMAPLAAGEHYIESLVGMQVVDADTGEVIGILEGVESVVTPSGVASLDRWWVKRPSGKTFAVPPAKKYLVKVDYDTRQILLHHWRELLLP